MSSQVIVAVTLHVFHNDVVIYTLNTLSVHNSVGEWEKSNVSLLLSMQRWTEIQD